VVVDQLKLLNDEEKKQVLVDFNENSRQNPAFSSFTAQMAIHAKNTPAETALVYYGPGEKQRQTLTYEQLNERANRLAGLLREKGVSPGEITAVMLDHNIDMMVGIWGILKAGGAYLPISPNYPRERIRYFLEDSAAPILLTKDEYSRDIPFNGEIIDITDETVYEHSNIEPPVEHTPDDPVYIIYTSGSTGKPKGVMVRNEGFVNLLNWFTREFGIDSEERNLLIAPVGFDLAQKNLFCPLISGGTLYLLPMETFNYENVSQLIETEGITILNCAPSVFYPFIELNTSNAYTRLKTLRKLFLGGESIQTQKLLPWLDSENFNCRIYNTYGPTECTDIVSSHPVETGEIRRGDTIPIGKGIDNVALYILDNNRKPQPVTIAGELYIGGICLAAGYCNDQQLGKEKFVETPHLPETTVYQTGDMCRWHPD
ncbi:MAG: amino acid adenylation domain-containing protein, partial [bacterium]|nr:amino acid adenylation domain-containing protein [bacterium]